MHMRYALLLTMLLSLPPVFFGESDFSNKRYLFKINCTQNPRSAAKDVIDKRNRIDEAKFFESISENPPVGSISSTTNSGNKLRQQNKERNLFEIKALLAKLLEKIEEIDTEEQPGGFQGLSRNNLVTPQFPQTQSSVFRTYRHFNTMSRYSEQPRISSSSPKLSLIKMIERRRRKKDRKEEKRQRWGKWTNWSPCSVSCGKGREIRWRHCLENCDIAETEMEEKTCQLPACGPSKLFGVIKLR